MTTIEIHFLGGTIGYGGAADGEPVRLGADALLAAVPGLDRLDVTLGVRAADPVPSASLTFVQLSGLAREAAAACADGTADAIVVVQGTDTLEESAYLLDLLWDRPEPVVLTGAMRNPTLTGPTGRRPAGRAGGGGRRAVPRARRARRPGGRGARGPLGAEGAHDASALLRLSRRRTARCGGRGSTHAPAAAGLPRDHAPADGAPHGPGAGPDRGSGRGPGRGRRARWCRRRAGGGCTRRWSRAWCAGRTAGSARRGGTRRTGQPDPRRPGADRHLPIRWLGDGPAR